MDEYRGFIRFQKNNPEFKQLDQVATIRLSFYTDDDEGTMHSRPLILADINWITGLMPDDQLWIQITATSKSIMLFRDVFDMLYSIVDVDDNDPTIDELAEKIKGLGIKEKI